MGVGGLVGPPPHSWARPHPRPRRAMVWGPGGSPTIFSTARRKFRNGAAAWRLPVLDVEVGEDDGDVGYLPMPSAWTEERHGVLPTATGRRRRVLGVQWVSTATSEACEAPAAPPVSISAANPTTNLR